MDAIDLVLTEFDGDKMEDICTYSCPYARDMQQKMATLRDACRNKTQAEISALPEFDKIHDEYIRQIADCINEMLALNKIDKATIDAIGFHGKTLDHCPPSIAKRQNISPYTLQIGSGQMLADLTGIRVVYDFRSDYINQGFEGAPLVPLHNAHIALTEGDGCYYNGGNTSNFAIIRDGKAVLSSDAGPFNEYTDAYIRTHTDMSFDKNGELGNKGKVDIDFMAQLFESGKEFYDLALPKSGDPAYYKKAEIMQTADKSGLSFNDVVRTFEYFAAYIAAYTLTKAEIDLPRRFILFGGGWKNPIVREAFADLLNGKGTMLPAHTDKFRTLTQKLNGEVIIQESAFGDYMEARLMADMARFRLENKPWTLPETDNAGRKIISGIIATPDKNRLSYNDKINRAAKK